MWKFSAPFSPLISCQTSGKPIISINAFIIYHSLLFVNMLVIVREFFFKSIATVSRNNRADIGSRFMLFCCFTLFTVIRCVWFCVGILVWKRVNRVTALMSILNSFLLKKCSWNTFYGLTVFYNWINNQL